MVPSEEKGKKSVIPKTIDSLPDELLSEILVRVPAEDLHEKARFICWRWYRTIHGDAFAQAHLQHTNFGLILQGGPAIFVRAAAQGGIEISELSYKSRSLISYSCNGLILMRDLDRDRDPYIVNPVTKARFNLPQLADSIGGQKCFGIAYVAASMEYKVVASYRADRRSLLAQCAILTVGVNNTWRNVATPQLSPKANWLLFQDPLITEGFVHWPSIVYGIVSMNVETETITEIPYPASLPSLEYRGCKYYYLSTGRHLSVLIASRDLLWDVWEMRGENGEWRNLVRQIDLRAHEGRISQIHRGFIKPVGWVKYPDALAFSFKNMPSPCIVYNLVTDEIDSFDLDSENRLSVGVVHRNSLVRLA